MSVYDISATRTSNFRFHVIKVYEIDTNRNNNDNKLQGSFKNICVCLLSVNIIVEPQACFKMSSPN